MRAGSASDNFGDPRVRRERLVLSLQPYRSGAVSKKLGIRMPRFVFQTDRGRQSLELVAVNGVGRHPNNTIQLLDTVVSKEHCVVEQRGAVTILRDLGSMNGTFINGERIQGERTLRHGDEIRLGNTTLMFDDGINQLPVPTPAVSPGAIQHTGATPVATPGPPKWAQNVHPVATSPVVPLPPAHMVSVIESARSIGSQVASQSKDFLAFDEASKDRDTLRLDYERLRITWELLREIGLERDIEKLLEKILVALFRFVAADRGVILLKEPDGTLKPRAHRRRKGNHDAISVSSTILAHVMKERAGVLTHDASSDFAASEGKSMFLNRISSAIVVPLLHNKEVIGVLWLDSETVASFKPKDLELITAVGNQVAMLVSNTLLALKVEKEIMTRERFSRLLSPNVAEQVISGKLEIKKGGIQIPNATVFNSDIRGFTSMSEKTSADEMVELLNEYFELMVEVIFKHEGTLDKFMGDGIMAFWGAPAFHPDDAVRSVLCSLEQMDVLDQHNAQRKARGEVELEIGIGIHTGPLVSGYVGSSKSLSYTVIGDTVNTSARLCGAAAAGQILISEATAAAVGGKFKLEKLADKELKNKAKPVPVFNVKRS
jgi:adenylate cyclase